MGDLAAFRAATAALFKPGECSISLFGSRDTDGSGDILWLDDVQDPEQLPSYWTLSVPGWYHPDMGNLHVPKFDGIPGVRSHHQDVCIDGSTILSVEAGTAPDVFPETSPFLVFEVDYLLVGKEKPTPEAKKLQRDAMAYAFQASGFPFAVLTDSGGKSIHATVRLDDDLATIQAWRQSVEYRRLLDLCWVVFGNFDIGVLKQSGRARLVRTPGARRDDGAPQTILATGQRVNIHGLMSWFASQLTPDAQQEVWSREPIDKPESPLRQRYLRMSKWRNEVTTPTTQHRGEQWRKIANSLAIAGCIEPRLVMRPCPQAPCGQWAASWLWYASAFVFNVYSSGWFFSQDSHEWERPDRLRWESGIKNKELLINQLKFEKATDPVQNALVDQMLMVQAQQVAQQQIAQLPMPPQVGPPVHVGGVTGATMTTDPKAAQPTDSKQGKKKDYSWVMDKFYKAVPQGYFVKLSDMHGGYWYLFDGRIWGLMTSDFARTFISRVLNIVEYPNKEVSEAYAIVERTLMLNTQWIENPHAIAFNNGTLYITATGLEFKPTFDPADRLRSLVPCDYNPQAQCPQWERFVRWALPDPSRMSMLQEMFGYTLIPGQPYQSFFMLTGSGSNGKSVVLALLQAMHKDSFETVALANLGGRFSLGTLSKKRLAIDTEAENVTNLVMGEGNSATAILKAWTGGDPVKIEAKKIQGWSETINAKYIMACNRKPRFVDPTKGVWRRLKLLKFESHIDDRSADVNLPQRLVREELPGVVNWAIQGLVRLVQQNGFTKSELLAADLLEYQTDSDSVAQFFTEFLRPAPADSAGAWFDVRPFHEAYKQYCGQISVPPVGESEFRQRLVNLGVHIGRPTEHDPVMNCPAGFERMPGPQYWATKGWRCYHPAYTTQTLMGSYVKQAAPQMAPQMQGAR